MKRARMGIVGVATGLVLAALLAGTAVAASMSVTAAIKQQDRAVRGSAALHKLKNFDGTTPASVRKIIPAVDTLASKFDHAALVVSRASATSARQRAGRRDWVSGVRTEATGLRQLDVAFRDLAKRDKPAAKTAARRATRTLQSGGAMIIKGDKLLGLPTSD